MLKKKSQLSTLCGAGLFFSNTEMQQRVYHVIKRHLLKRVVWACLGYNAKSSPGIADAYVQEVWPLKCGSSFAALSIYSKGMQRTSCKIGKRIQRHHVRNSSWHWWRGRKWHLRSTGGHSAHWMPPGSLQLQQKPHGSFCDDSPTAFGSRGSQWISMQR